METANILLTTDLSEAAALTAMGCPLNASNAGFNSIKPGERQPTKVFVFQKNARTQRLMWFFRNEQAGQDEQQFTEKEERTIMRLFKHADVNRKEMLFHINKGKALAMMPVAGGGWKLQPCTLTGANDGNS